MEGYRSGGGGGEMVAASRGVQKASQSASSCPAGADGVERGVSEARVRDVSEVEEEGWLLELVRGSEVSTGVRDTSEAEEAMLLELVTEASTSGTLGNERHGGRGDGKVRGRARGKTSSRAGNTSSSSSSPPPSASHNMNRPPMGFNVKSESSSTL